MNTDPLPFIPYPQSSSPPSKTINEIKLNWRELILKHEMESIWHRIAGLAQSQGDVESDMSDKTQDLFLRLLTEQRLNTYVDENWSEEQITRELLSLMPSQAKT
jgi:hypothetical protein